MSTTAAASPFERIIDRVSLFIATRAGWWIAVCLLLLAACGAMTYYVAADIDLFTRVATGRLIEVLGGIPQTDPWAYTPRKPVWHEHELFPCALFYLVSQHGGDLALFALKCGFAIVTLLIIVLAQRSAGNATAFGLALFALTLPDMLFVWVSTVRAQVITYLCYSLFLFSFVRARYHGDYRWLLVLPLFEVLWVNSHGGFIVGIVFSTIFTAQMLLERRARLPVLISWTGVVVSPFLNMYGPSFLLFIFGAVTHLPFEINEWFPLRPWTANGFVVYGTAAIVLLGRKAWRRVPREGIFFMSLSAAEGFRHDRLTPLYTMSLIVYGTPLFQAGLARIHNALRDRWLVIQRSFVLSCAVLVALCVGRLLYWIPKAVQGFRFDYTNYPVEAIEWLRESRPGGRILTHYNDGSYTLWRMGENFKISLDGRYDGVYPPETIRMGLEAYEGPTEAQRIALKAFDPDYVLLGPTTPGLCDKEANLREVMFPDYSVGFSDGRFCILERGGSVTTQGVATTFHQRLPMWAPLN